MGMTKQAHSSDSQPSDIAVETITSDAGLAALEGEWNPLLQSSRSDTVFLTFEWISTWWRVYGARNRLHVLTARDENGRLIGIAPLNRVRRHALGIWAFNTVQFIGSGNDVTPEHLDFIISPGREAQVVDEFVRHLCADSSVQAIDLRPFREPSPNLAAFSRHLSARGEQASRSSDSDCPVFELPESMDRFIATRSHNYRKKIGEYQRRCERDLAPRLRLSLTSGDVKRDMTMLIELHRKRWGRRSSAFRSSEYRRFHEELAARLHDRGWVRIFSLETGSQQIALLYCFAYRDHYYYYQGGWDPSFARYRVGLVLMHKVIQEAIAEGATVFDFLRGDEA